MTSKSYTDELCAAENSVTVNCDPCQYEGIQRESRAYCQDCNEFLCQDCMQAHRKFQAFRLHSILREKSMPKTRETTSRKLALKLCDDHRLNEVQFYCSNHDSVFCGLCRTAKHSTCENKRINDIIGEDDRKEFKDVASDIEKLKGEFGQFRTNDIVEIDFSRHKRERLLLNTLRQRMNKCFDRLQSEIIDKEKEDRKFVENHKENAALFKEAVKNITLLQEDIDQVSQSNDTVAIFAATKKLKRICNDYTLVKSTATPEQRIKFEDKRIMEMEELCENVCRVTESKTFQEVTSDIQDTYPAETQTNQLPKNSSTATADSSLVDVREQNKAGSENRGGQQQQTASNEKKSFANLNMTKRYKISISDRSECDITGSVFLPDGSLVLCDHKNGNIILLDKSFKETDTLHFEGNPWDVAVFSENEIIVSLPDEKVLTYMTIDSGKLHRATNICQRKSAWGIAVHNETLITTFRSNRYKGGLQIRNKNGQIIRTIADDVHGEDLFIAPLYVNVDQSSGKIYVSDNGQNTVFCLNLDGKILFKVSNEIFGSPKKLTVDDEGDCIVCASLYDKIVLVGTGLVSSRMSGKAKLEVWMQDCARPQSVSMRWEDHTAIVGMNKSNEILVVKGK